MTQRFEGESARAKRNRREAKPNTDNALSEAVRYRKEEQL